MAQQVDLQQMSIPEKLRLMEALWSDLSREDISSPSWHGAVLAERESLTSSGKESFIDWELAKKQLRDHLT